MFSRKLICFAGSLLGLTAAMQIVGCGEQSLYEPPESPYRATGRAELPSEVEDVDILGTYAYVAAGQGGLHVFDISNPEEPQHVLWKDTVKYAEVVRVARTRNPADGSLRDLAFVLESTEGIATYDISAVPDSVHDFGQRTTAVDATGLSIILPEMMTDPYAVYLADSWKGVRVFYSIPEYPGLLDYKAFVSTTGYTQAVDVVGDYAYIAEDQMGVSVADVSNVRTGGMTLIANVDTPGEAQGIDVDGDFAFVADGESGLQILAIDANHQLELISSLSLFGDCRAIEVRDGVAFLAAEDAGLHVVDVRNPYHPVALGNVATSYAQGVAVGEDNIVCIADRDDGLVVFRGPTLPPDDIAPAAISDLAVRLNSTSSLSLNWQAPGDNGAEGTAEVYDLRWSYEELSEATWENASSTPIPRRPRPQIAGTMQTLTLSGLTLGDTLFFAIKTWDHAGNASALSNVARAIMTTPSLTDYNIVPRVGTAVTPFTYSVTYTDPEGDAPAVATVLIDGSPYEMSSDETNPDYAAGVVYRYGTALEMASHTYQFVFDDGHGPLVNTPVVEDPWMVDADPLDFTMPLITVSGGSTFTMGSSTSETGRDSDELQHEVTLTRDYVISEIEVTEGLYYEITGERPADFSGFLLPVESVTWFDAVRFCNLFSLYHELEPAYLIQNEQYDEQNHLTFAVVSWNPEADGYRLPTEAEWEYACRAGSATALSGGDLLARHEHCEVDEVTAVIAELAWYCGNADIGAGPRPHDVAAKNPNGFGLYDMHGNVWEWCWDQYADYPAGPVTDPTGPEGEPWPQRVRRGGSWYYYARDCRSASRDAFWPGSADNTLGFRLTRNAD